MSVIKAVELDGEIIYIQVDDDLSIDNSAIEKIDDNDFERKGDRVKAVPIVNNLKGLIKTMAKTTLDSISEATSSAKVDKVTLEFSVKLSSEAGFFVASGKAEGSVKVSVDLSFPDKG